MPSADATTANARAVVLRTYSSMLSISGLIVDIIVARPGKDCYQVANFAFQRLTSSEYSVKLEVEICWRIKISLKVNCKLETTSLIQNILLTTNRLYLKPQKKERIALKNVPHNRPAALARLEMISLPSTLA